MKTQRLRTAGADLVHDVRGPLPTADGRPPLFMIGQPMDTTGFAALAAAPTRVVIAVGEESANVQTGRTSVATAELLGQRVTVFPSHHAGFCDGKSGYPGKPDEFARRLRQVLDGTS
ncbi:hypothetical protein [Streptomyces sp. NPDC001744]|uniref:hypothetical protein n=1 Tax=Streptomyces sp. NPDC001744 TaxID=3364606 RepID=UPI0036CE47D1